MVYPILILSSLTINKYSVEIVMSVEILLTIFELLV